MATNYTVCVQLAVDKIHIDKRVRVGVANSLQAPAIPQSHIIQINAALIENRTI